ncbi:major head protein [Vibrio phage CP-T1]|uniref:Putative major capsid protein n=1 Tax=Vibrio phage Rostov M3 TaxID=2660724 RepID=A0A5Q2WB81_9CAUD|nr:major head protein [Vibrio phage CP-T1]AFC22423.1 putative major capsid protein [Vibrio phage CP-T1]AIA08723.1 putative major capsid protein [Vibrio phage 24]QGH75002.1 putative major capsid protein [Vibrio phage Rostov M3]
MPKQTFTLDADLPQLGMIQGQSVSFNDNLPTMDDGWAFYISQFAQLETKIYEAKYTNINFAELIPVDTSYPEWADSWDYISYDAVTLGKFIGSSADDLPKVGLKANKSSVPIGYAGNAFDYSLDELRKSQQLRMPIDTTKGRMAFRGAQEHTQKVAYFGDASRGMTGLFNNPNLALDNSTTNWSTATGQDIIDDMNGLFIKVWTDSANVHVPNTLVLDSTRYAQISSQRMDTGTDTTVLEFFLKNNLYTSLTGQTPRVVPRLQLTAAVLAANGVSNGGKDRMVAYELNDENLGMVNPIPWRALAPQMKGLNIETPCEYKISGVEWRFPFSGAYRDHV